VTRTAMTTRDYLDTLGVPELPPRTCPFDPGYDPVTLEAHLEQSAALMASLKISMACWLIADEGAVRRKVRAAQEHGVATVTGGGPFEIAVASGVLAEYLDLCADIGFSRIECGRGFTDMPLGPEEVIGMARERNLGVEVELGSKHEGAFADDTVDALVAEGRAWLDAGAERLVVEARESAVGVGLFDDAGRFNAPLADRFATELGLESVVFEAPNKASQFRLLDHFGPAPLLSNVRLEELLRVEIYRRGLHSDAFQVPGLRPSRAR
jgi:phosphosulfolactate synthase